MISSYVTEQELTKVRTPGELARWVAQKTDELASQPGGKDAVRMRSGLCKQLTEEVYPLSILASHAYGNRDDVTIEPVLGNQNYDAIITVDDRRMKLEITLAHEGEKEFLRRLMLKEQGHAPAFGDIKKTGTKNRGIVIESESIAHSVDEILDSQIDLIRKAVHRKLKNKYENGTELLIMFEDVISFHEPEEWNILKSIMKDELGPLACKNDFSSLHLASWSKRIYMSWSPE